MKKELQLEISYLREDIQSSEIIQVKPYINGKVEVSNPKWHLQTHLNTIERLIDNTPTSEEIIIELNNLYGYDANTNAWDLWTYSKFNKAFEDGYSTGYIMIARNNLALNIDQNLSLDLIDMIIKFLKKENK